MVQNPTQRVLIEDGQHATEVTDVLSAEISSAEAMRSIRHKAIEILQRSVDPKGGPPEQPSDGLLYGLIQSGKTSIITVAAGMAADNGFNCIVILTPDIDLLYDQTLQRVRRALRGLSVLGKNDWKDAERFERQLRSTPIVIVCSKNGRKLGGLLDAFKKARVKGFSTLIIDDEADQASLNTYTSKGEDQVSRINEVITEFRNYFPLNTYLQVTATPQALFLQRPDHRYRPSFTVLSEPGHGYVGGDEFFGDTSESLLRRVDLNEVDELLTARQPSPSGAVPQGLKQALYTFLVAATSRVIADKSSGYAFLCHVSMQQLHHNHVVMLIDKFKRDTLDCLTSPDSMAHGKLMEQLRKAYEDLSGTEVTLPSFDEIVKKIQFYLPGAKISVINATSKEEIELDAVYNIFVGGNKFGRGVTIKNLLVSYYGRNPRVPNSDTVLQHARMYGYRQKELGITRLFLPDKLKEHFRLIHQMESALRDLVNKHPSGQFEVLYVFSPLRPTRRNVLDPNSLGMYLAGGSYNPRYPLRTPEMKGNTEWLDEKLSNFNETTACKEVKIDFVKEILNRCPPDPTHGTELWDMKTIDAALEEVKYRCGDRAYLVVRRGRDLQKPREETQQILSGGEISLAPTDAPTLFIFRQNEVRSKGEIAIWWPQLRFPDGGYVLTFSFDR